MVEMYTMQRFLDPKGLADRGLEHFDAWAATFSLSRPSKRSRKPWRRA
jgi:N12 class adenine-specific DNA methylase